MNNTLLVAGSRSFSSPQALRISDVDERYVDHRHNGYPTQQPEQGLQFLCAINAESAIHVNLKPTMH